MVNMVDPGCTSVVFFLMIDPVLLYVGDVFDPDLL